MMSMVEAQTDRAARRVEPRLPHPDSYGLTLRSQKKAASHSQGTSCDSLV
jgi:hypothetical protein